MKATTTLGVLMAAAIACGGGSKQQAAPSATEAAAEPAPPPEPAKPKGSSMGVGADAARARSTFAMFPASTSVVGGVSIAQLRSSAAWPALQRMAEQRAGAELEQVRDECKLDPAQVVDSIEFATSLAAQAEIVLVLDGSFTRAAVAQCGPLVAKSHGHTLTVTDDGPVTSYDDGSETIWIGWPTENRAVAVADRDQAWLEARLAGTDSIREDDAFMEIVGNVDTSSTAWLAIVDDSGSMQVMAGFLGGKVPTAAFMSIRMSDVVKGEVGLVFASEDDAQVARGELERILDQAKGDPTFGPIVSTAHVGAYGANAVVEFDLNQQQFEKLIQMVPSLPN